MYTCIKVLSHVSRTTRSIATMSSIAESGLSFSFEHDEDDDAFSYEDGEENDAFSYEDDIDVDEAIGSGERQFLDELITKLAYDNIWYKPWLVRDYMESHMLKPASQLRNSHLQLSELELLVLLDGKRWQPDEAVIWLLEDKKSAYHEMGLPFPFDELTYQIREQQDYSCMICCEEYDKVMTFTMGCGHDFCTDCYASYIQNEMHHGRLIKCIDPECNMTIPHKFGEKILCLADEKEGGVKVIDGPTSENRLLLAQARVEVAKNRKKFVGCPLVDCQSFVEVVQGEVDPDPKNTSVVTVPVVKCAESHEFCFRCHYENHLPCPCYITQLWIRKCADDLETANWIEANTHNCPGCDGAIEKNGGCNHMTCRTCKKEFCWICNGDWATHKNYYNCNKFREEGDPKDLERNRKRELLKRYLHYYKRFLIHDLLMKGDRKTVEQVEKIARLCMEDMAQQDTAALSWNDIQFLTDAIVQLTKGRKTLKWTYVLAYYLGDLNLAQIFESNQDYLTMLVEELLKIFEELVDKRKKVMEKANTKRLKMILNVKSQIVNLLSTIQLRLRNVIEYAEVNLKQGLLKFET